MNKIDKKKIRIIFGSVLILIIVVGFFGFRWAQNVATTSELKEGDEYIPEPEISEEQSMQTTVNLYFPNKETNKLEVETKLVNVKELMNIPYEKIVNLLAEGPKNENLKVIIPEGTKVLKSYMDKDCLVLDLTKDFLNYDMEQENEKENLIYSIVNSLTELTEVNKVKIIIEGNDNEQFNEIYERKVN